MVPRWSLVKSPIFWLVGVVLLGLGLRTFHYLHNPPIWHDEAAQVMNVLNKSYGEQLGPLYYSEAAPPLFMWAEKAVVGLLGDSLFALRLLPWFASCLAFLGMLWVGWRLLPWQGMLWLGLLFACSDRLLWHGCEAKPYALDVLVAVVLLITLVRPWQNHNQADHDARLPSRLILYVFLTPVLIWLSFPACFLLGGLALSLLPGVWRQRSIRLGLWYGLFLLVLGGSFLILLKGPIHAQRVERLLDCWQDFFPTWEQPWKIPPRLAQRLTEVFRYALEPVGNVLCLVAVVGGVWLWRQGQRLVLAFLLLPLGLTVVAWLMGQYLLGPLRVVVFMAPAALLLIAAGTLPALSWLKLRCGYLGPVVLTIFLLFPCVQAGWRLAVPWKRLDSAEPATFVLHHRQPNEPVVGTMWEHAYYFRHLGQAYRPLNRLADEPPAPPPTVALTAQANAFVPSLWLVMEYKPFDNRPFLDYLLPQGEWIEEQRYQFRNVTVMHVKRKGEHH